MTTQLLPFVFTLLVAILLSCQKPAPIPTSYLPEKILFINPDSIYKDSIQKANVTVEEIMDSIRLAKLTEAAMSKIQSFSNQQSAKYECDSFRFVKGHLINSTSIHTLLYVSNNYFGKYSILELEDKTWKNLLNLESNHATQGVLFKDMNGDGQQDFVLEGYAMAGSGEKYFNQVYLYNLNNHHFDFIEGLGMNPHFYPRKNIVTCYYNPAGVWSAEKYRLHWNKLELIEEIEIDLQEVVESTGKLEGNRKIYRYRDGNKVLYKNDHVCSFPKEYKPYRELVKTSKSSRKIRQFQ